MSDYAAERASSASPGGAQARSFGLSNRLVGRSAALLFAICGIVNLVAALQPVPGVDGVFEATIGVGAIVAGMIAWYLPWNRWPAHASLWLAPFAFCGIALSNASGGQDPWSYAAFFLVTFAWLGICHPRGTSLVMLPLFVAAYLLPLPYLGQATSVALVSTLYVGIACLLVGESVGWVSERWRSAQAALQEREAEERFRALVQNSSDLITVVRPDATIEYCSPSVEGILGYTGDELVGTSFGELVHRDDAAQVARFLADCDNGVATTAACHWRLRRRDRSYRQIETVGANLVDHPQVRGLVLTSRDVTERKALEEQLSHQAYHDALTGLGNLALLRDRLSHALARGKRRKASLGLLFIDLDNFKPVNDSRGHTAGDQVLATVAGRLEECVRGVDTVARLGGDEFAVLLEDLSGEPEAAEVASRIVAELAAPIALPDSQVVIGASIGIAVSDSGRVGAEELMRNADIAMYAAKRAGKGRYAHFDPSMHGAVLERLELEKELGRAVEAGELQMFYQPIVNLRTGAVDTVEALLRWPHPSRGLLLPEAFLPLAEETGLIVPIGHFTCADACRQLGIWHKAGGAASVAVSVNLSARQLADPSLIEMLEAALADAGVDPRYLILEITETTLIQDMAATSRRLEALRALGVRLALDDFGTGYSSLSYLQRFRVDMLKVDRSFVAAHREGSDGSTLAGAIISLGHALNLQTVAEGIEDVEELDWVRGLGCEFGQGYHLAEPMPGDTVARFLTERG